MDSDGQGTWERVSAELRAYRDLQHQAWGDIDNATLGRYLAGEVSDDERRHVEQALADLPDLRLLTDLVKDVLSEYEPAPQPAPTILSFPAPRQAQPPRRGLSPRWRQRFVLVAAACLLMAIGLKMPRLTQVSAPPPEPMASLDGSVALRIADPQKDGFFLAPAGPEIEFPAPEPPRAAPVPGHAAVNHASGTFVMARKESPMSEVDRRRKLIQAETYYEQAHFYQSRGDLSRAAPPLSQAHALLANTVGSQDPRTQQSLQSLAQVYAVALNAPAPSAYSNPYLDAGKSVEVTEFSPDGNKHSSHRIVMAGADAPPPRRDLHKRSVEAKNAVALRERLTCQHPRVLRSAVTPVLAQAYQQAPTARERANYARALGNLGPAARDAVPLLAARLRQGCPHEEKQAILAALGSMGAGARSAIPDVVETLEKAKSAEDRQEATQTLVSLGPCARSAVQDCCRSKTPANPALKDALARLNGRDGRIGVLDEADCFSVRALRQSNHLIHLLAHDTNVEVYVHSVPAGTETLCKQCCDHLGEMSPCGVCILIQRDKGSAVVTVSDSLRQRGLDAKQLEKVIERRLSRKEYDTGLLEGMNLVARHASLRPGR